VFVVFSYFSSQRYAGPRIPEGSALAVPRNWFGSSGPFQNQKGTCVKARGTFSKQARVSETCGEPVGFTNIKTRLIYAKIVNLISTNNTQTRHQIRLSATGRICPAIFISIKLNQLHGTASVPNPIANLKYLNINTYVHTKRVRTANAQTQVFLKGLGVEFEIWKTTEFKSKCT